MASLKHQKTYMEDFFEKFPNALRNNLGEPKCCPENIYPELDKHTCQHYNSCTECWNQTMKEVEKKANLKHQKTYMEDFFERFPNAPKNDSGEPKCCISNMYSEFEKHTCQRYDSCKKCWNQIMKEVE